MFENLSLWEQLNTASIKKLRTLLYEELNSLNEYIKNYKIKLGIIGDISKSRTPLGFGNLIKDLKLLLKISSSEEKENYENYIPNSFTKSSAWFVCCSFQSILKPIICSSFSIIFSSLFFEQAYHLIQ